MITAALLVLFATAGGSLLYLKDEQRRSIEFCFPCVGGPTRHQ